MQLTYDRLPGKRGGEQGRGKIMCGIARKIIAVLALKGCFRIWDVSPTAILSGMYSVRSMVYVRLHIYVYSTT